MLEIVAALGAGLAVTTVGVALAIPAPRPGAPRWLAEWLAAERERAVQAGWPALDVRVLLAAQAAVGAIGASAAASLTGLAVLAVPGGAGAVFIAREVVARRARAHQAVRQDAVIEAVRMMRQLLETGATSVNQAVALLAERGPLPLRTDFRALAAKSVGRREAWRRARERVGEPLFDMLAAAVLIQHPGGGELTPLFEDLELSVSAAQEVEREARALQSQARSASTIIVALPLVFLTILSALRSPYLDAFHHPSGEVFLLAMLAVMAAGYLWMRRMLDLPGLQRVRLTDA